MGGRYVAKRQIMASRIEAAPSATTAKVMPRRAPSRRSYWSISAAGKHAKYIKNVNPADPMKKTIERTIRVLGRETGKNTRSTNERSKNTAPVFGTDTTR